MRKDSKIPCYGDSVSMGASAQTTCDEKKAVLIVRTASNSYFPMAMGALSIPAPDSALKDAVTPLAEVIRHFTPEIFMTLVAVNPRLAALRGYPAADVLAMRDKVLSARPPSRRR